MTDTFFSEFLKAEIFFKQNKGDNDFDERKKVFFALYSYVLSCKWHDTIRTHDLMKNIRFSSADAAQHMGISPNTVRSARSSASNRLYSLFGKNVFQIIESGSSYELKGIYDLVYILSCNYDNAEHFIPISLIEEITAVPRECISQYSVEELSSELSFIRCYDMLKMHRRLQKLDMDKLHYILDVMREAVFDYSQEDCINTKRFELLREIIHA
ncbi:MAG: hypothetical protein IJ010_01465 [Ruminococcus sp.]|nr:hypothetical protein [Ruminococcus sp.]